MAFGEPTGFSGGIEPLLQLNIFAQNDTRLVNFEGKGEIFANVMLFISDNDPTNILTEPFTTAASYRIPSWNFNFNVVGSDTVVSIDRQPEVAFLLYLYEETTGQGTGRRILQTDLDEYEAAFTFTDTFELDLPDGIVSTIDDLSDAGVEDEVRISTQSLQIGTQFNDDANY
jgi:hypothetical protein